MYNLSLIGIVTLNPPPPISWVYPKKIIKKRILQGIIVLLSALYQND
jgi:hypothetical protein